MDPVPDPLLLRKSGSAGDRTRDLCICSHKLWPLDHRRGRFYSGNKLKMKDADSSLRTGTEQLWIRHFLVQDSSKPQNHQKPTDSFRKVTRNAKYITCFKNIDKKIRDPHIFLVKKGTKKVSHNHRHPKFVNVTQPKTLMHSNSNVGLRFKSPMHFRIVGTVDCSHSNQSTVNT